MLANYIATSCLVAAVILVIYTQYALGVTHRSVRTALTFPIGYAILVPTLTFALVGITADSALFAGSQLIVAYWLYWVYEFGVKHPQQGDKSATKATAHTLSLRTEKK
ncbi:hypothetical protein [Levilactobacillus koreensis]|uniref:Uncharacterized protein n=1 Tax=Levilactobacillus koreensis TaxID=637971 RepID=A0AAC8UUS4_9LACO|nr:hypothetical protein [Levilactobacillus koreensis]AKP64865.1 hypothetical protein ABN16_07545 [Levilactobacillus koreensis]